MTDRGHPRACEDDIVTGIRQGSCGRPAKWLVLDAAGQPGKALCGIHRRSFLAWIPRAQFAPAVDARGEQ